MFSQIFIRRAQPTEGPVLSEIATRTFHDTFAADNHATDIATYLRDRCSTKQFESELADTHNTFLLAFAKETTAPSGYAKLRANSTESNISGPNPIEIERLYVEKAAIGHGVGAQLMRACLDEAVVLGHCTVWLGVWEHNTRAIRFYQRWGFETVGSHIFTMGSDEQNDLIMQRSVFE